MNIKLLALLASIVAVSLAQPAPSPFTPGSAVSKLKRAAEALDDILDGENLEDAVRRNPSCWQPGNACAIARRDAIELAGAIAEARAVANPDASAAAAASMPHDWCKLPGNFCDKMNKWNDAVKTKLAAVEADVAHVKRRDEGNELEEAMLNECHRPGNACFEARAAGSVGGLSQLLQWFAKTGTSQRNGNAGQWWNTPKYCHQVGEPCLKLKRAQDLIVDLAAGEEAFDGVADNEKRTLDPATRALIELGREVAAKQLKG